MAEHQKKKMRQLSGGMKRRVGLVQALLNEPEFLIVDEPTTGLDPEERIRIRNLLVDFSKNRTVLFPPMWWRIWPLPAAGWLL